jgi:hypothetical protein
MEETIDPVMNKIKTNIRFMILSILGIFGCAGSVPDGDTSSVHMAEIRSGESSLYVDPADNRLVMNISEERAGSSGFYSYRVGFRDRSLPAPEHEHERRKYFDYDMQRDWRLVAGGDSIAPVFFQPVPGLDKLTREGVLVFEIPTGIVPEALVYHDTFGDWGKQLIVLHSH